MAHPSAPPLLPPPHTGTNRIGSRNALGKYRGKGCEIYASCSMPLCEFGYFDLSTNQLQMIAEHEGPANGRIFRHHMAAGRSIRASHLSAVTEGKQPLRKISLSCCPFPGCSLLVRVAFISFPYPSSSVKLSKPLLLRLPPRCMQPPARRCWWPFFPLPVILRQARPLLLLPVV